MTDDKRERLVHAAHRWLLQARTEREQRAACQTMTRLCRGRSPTQIARMERSRGLR